MARSRSDGVQQMRWGRLAFVGLTVAGIAALTAGYAMQRGAHDALGLEIKAMEKKEAWAKAEAILWRERLARQRRRDVILRQVQEMNLELTNIVPSQRWIIPLRQFPLLSPSSSVPDASSAIPQSRGGILRPLAGAASPAGPRTR
ncbi:MAG: hypothetical protein KIT22_07760 [Verrucomicrobiae bacterium]|nr:hypothetical protein [Verrucomicrobiae bacterium]